MPARIRAGAGQLEPSRGAGDVAGEEFRSFPIFAETAVFRPKPGATGCRNGP